ncbi:hypothetical protein J1N35_038059 [Gossypium stocksii]|uniref:Rx N-terminal domain-containing protein n=1 Tax=Gossypium stocksii TaxID=47602 RepID=A0A9D3UL60_9ROSI|nr:hypothetical protein J1N35_038059 [Gossypium stocksii]
MADAVMCVALEVALSRAVSILEDQINLAWDFKDKLNKFCSSLTLTRAFLQDAERRQLDEPVKVWLEQLRDIAYEADDVLDELAYEHVRWKVDNQMSKKACNFFSLSKNPMAFTLKMSKKVKNIDLSIKDINRQATDFGLQQRLQISSPVSSRVGGGTHSFGDSSRVVGREADVLKIVLDLLIGSTTHQSLSITSIVGMAVVGEEYWSIIKERAFGNSSISSKSEVIGRDIARKCGVFPKDFRLRMEELIQLWMAEGLLQQSKGSSQLAFEDIGNEYFNDLLSNSLLHDLVHDLA